MSIRRIAARWRRARRAGRDLDLVAYAAALVGGTVYLAAMTGVLGPTLDAAPQAIPASHYSADAASAAHAPY
ncbi:hypothetical protein [Achromobacter arsenitoxydans]|uniref:Uncharacterized protein n=1 Tax=Achromobacter arsenitoxydans SY8 TaxID=477184 RepID=H0F9J8_9BURK|nr:hypothetical protein [Achromobacter arsenitoxydans]EHK65263.1 hypothetical protein KYC_17252 [Achromobacter arsenitoxydans SY8]